MTRTELMRKINDLMTAEGCSLSEDQDAVLAAALGAMWDEITGADQEPVGFVSPRVVKFMLRLPYASQVQHMVTMIHRDAPAHWVPLYTKEPK